MRVCLRVLTENYVRTKVHKILTLHCLNNYTLLLCDKSILLYAKIISWEPFFVCIYHVSFFFKHNHTTQSSALEQFLSWNRSIQPWLWAYCSLNNQASLLTAVKYFRDEVSNVGFNSWMPRAEIKWLNPLTTFLSKTRNAEVHLHSMAYLCNKYAQTDFDNPVYIFYADRLNPWHFMFSFLPR